MANQDTSAALLGSLGASVSAGVETQVSVSYSGTGSMTAIEQSQVTYSVDFSGSGDMTVEPTADISLAPINFDGSLSSSVATKNFINTYVSFYGFLNASTVAFAKCYDLIVDFEWQTIDSTKCSVKGKSVALTRYRGDTYPVLLKIAPNGNPDITGHTFQMSMQLTGGTLYTVNGTITNAAAGEVQFVPNPLAVAEAGTGQYDIQGNDGTYDYTPEKGVLTILADLTV